MARKHVLAPPAPTPTAEAGDRTYAGLTLAQIEHIMGTTSRQTPIYWTDMLVGDLVARIRELEFREQEAAAKAYEAE